MDAEKRHASRADESALLSRTGEGGGGTRFWEGPGQGGGHFCAPKAPGKGLAHISPRKKTSEAGV